MPSKHLTDKVVQSLKTTKHDEEVWDSGFKMRGISFGVRVFPSGAKEFICRYRNKRGNRRKMTLGDATRVSLSDAHAKAVAIISEVDEGNDPGQQRLDYKAAETFGELCDVYLRIHAAKNKKDGGKADAAVIERDLRPAWGAMKACDITRPDVIALLEKIAVDRDAPVMANRTRALISKIFNFALEREIVQATPCSGLPRKYREKRKDRVLSDDEVSALWTQLDGFDPDLAGFFKVTLLTAQRPGEVAAMSLDEIEGSVWTIPAGRTKNGLQHRIPLSKEVLALLPNKVGSKESAFRFCFPGDRGEYLPPRTIQKAARALSEALGGKGFTAHDLRRTAATHMRKLGASRETVAKILNHKSAERGVTGIYDRYDEWPEMRGALEKWAKQVSDVAEGRAPSSIHQFTGRR